MRECAAFSKRQLVQCEIERRHTLFSPESTYNAFFSMGRPSYSRRSDRVGKVAKREETAHHSSGCGKLNADHSAGRMRAKSTLWGGERPNRLLSADGLCFCFHGSEASCLYQKTLAPSA